MAVMFLISAYFGPKYAVPFLALSAILLLRGLVTLLRDMLGAPPEYDFSI
jgi:hypothetical protein